MKRLVIICVRDAPININARTVTGAYARVFLIWGLNIIKPGPRNHMVIADGPSWAGEAPRNIVTKHWSSISSSAYSGDGNVAVSCSNADPFVKSGTRPRERDCADS
jgi:hypothetical protein